MPHLPLVIPCTPGAKSSYPLGCGWSIILSRQVSALQSADTCSGMFGLAQGRSINILRAARLTLNVNARHKAAGSTNKTGLVQFMGHKAARSTKQNRHGHKLWHTVHSRQLAALADVLISGQSEGKSLKTRGFCTFL